MQGVLRLATVYIELCETGEVGHLKWQRTFHCKPKLISGDSVVSKLRAESEIMEECLRKWKDEMHHKRLEYNHLNHYNTQQLLFLRKNLASLSSSGPGRQIYLVM